MNIPVNIATEDELSEVVIRRLLTHVDRGFAVGVSFRRGGYGYLKKNIVGWNRAARSIPIVVLTDLDLTPCPLDLISSWLQTTPLHHNLCLRIAVREVEAWLLADFQNLAAYLKSRTKPQLLAADTLPDPKAALIQLARTSRVSDVKSRIVPKEGGTAQQGPDYNGCLGEFVRNSWDVDRAALHSESLARALRHLRRFQPVWA